MAHTSLALIPDGELACIVVGVCIARRNLEDLETERSKTRMVTGLPTMTARWSIPPGRHRRS